MVRIVQGGQLIFQRSLYTTVKEIESS